MKTIFYIIFVILLFFAQHTLAITQTRSDTITQKKIVSEISAYRLKNGLAYLQLNDYLSNEATSHSINMAETMVPFGHHGFKDRSHKLFSHFKHCQGIAENVAYVFFNTNDVVNLWL